MNSLLLSEILLPVDRYNQSWIKRTTKIDFVMTFRAFNIKKLKINCFVFCLFVFSIMCLFCLWRILWLARQQQNLWRNMSIINKRWKKNTPQLFSTKCRQWNLGFDLSHCKKKICTSKCLKLLIVTVDTKMFQTDFFLTDIRRVPIDNRNTLRVWRLNVYDLDVLFFKIENTHNSSSIIPLGKI